LFPQNIWIVLDSVLPARWYFLPPVYTCLNGVALANTERRPWHLWWFECLSVCVYVVNGITAPCLAKIIALRAPSTRASVALIEFESMYTEARLAVVGGLVASFEACVRIAETSHSSGLRAICLGLSHWLKFAPFCASTVSCRVCQVNASRPACMTSLSFDVHNAFHDSQTSSYLFWLPSASVLRVSFSFPFDSCPPSW